LIKTGKLSVFTLFILCLGVLLYTIYTTSMRKKKVTLRKIAGVNAIDESIGRAVEFGRPVAIDLHMGGVRSVDGVVALSYLDYIVRNTAASGANIVVGMGAPEVVPIAEEIVRVAYETSPKPEMYNPAEMINYIAPTQFGYTSGWLGLVGRTKPASVLLIGPMSAEAMIIGESGMMVGAMQIACSTSITNIPFLITSCDYVIMGEENYVGAAILSQNPVQLGCILGQDIFKILTLALILLGSLLSTIGVPWLTNLLGM